MALTTVKSDQIQTSVALAGSPTTTTQSASDNSTKIATTAYVDTAVTNLVDSAPASLNTLDELAAALNDDASFSTTVTNSIATKLPLAGGTLTGALVGTTATFAGGAANNNDDANILTLNASQHARLLVDTSSTGGHRATLALESNGNELTLSNTGSASYLTSVGNLEISGGKVGIGASPSSYYAKNLVVMTDGDGSGGMTLVSPATDDVAYYIFADGTSGAARYAGYVGYSHNSDNMFMGTAGTTRMTITSTGLTAVGGNHTPLSELHVKGTDETQVWIDSAANTNPGVRFLENGTNKWTIANDASNDGFFFYDFTASAERMRIDSSGRVGIGTNSPTATYRASIKGDYSSIIGGIEFDSGGGDKFKVGHVSATSPSGEINVVGSANLVLKTANTERMRIDSSGNVGIGTTNPAQKFVVAESTNGKGIEIAPGTLSYIQAYDRGAGDYCDLKIDAETIQFGTNNGTEAMRIDSSGVVKLITANDTAGTSKFLTFGTNSFNRAGIKCTNAATFDGSLEFYTGNASNFAERMRITSGGSVGIGTNSPSSYYANHLVVDTGSSAQSGITIVSDTNQQGMFAFADGTSGDTRYRGYINYNHVDDSLAFGSGGATALTINSIGNITQTFSDGSNVTAGNMPSVTGYTLTNTINSNGSGAKLEFSLNNGSAQAAIAAEQSAATSSSLNFYTENSGTLVEAMRIRADSNLALNQGSLIIPAGYGIHFGASTTGVSGATNSSVVLDDYEEGTWTPVFKDNGSTAITVSINNCRYVKVGQVVHVNGYVTRNDSASLSNYLRVEGLPFSSNGSTTTVSGGAWFDGTGTDEVSFCYVYNGYIYFKKVGSNSNYVTTNQFQNARPVYFATTYMASN